MDGLFIRSDSVGSGEVVVEGFQEEVGQCSDFVDDIVEKTEQVAEFTIHKIALEEQAFACRDVESLRDLLNKELVLSDPHFLRKLALQMIVRKDTKMLEFLIDLIGIDRQSEDGSTLLHAAAAIGNRGVIRFLLVYGASPSIINDIGYTPRDIALSCDFSEFGELLAYPGMEESSRNKKEQKVLGQFISTLAKNCKGQLPDGRVFNLEGNDHFLMRQKTAELASLLENHSQIEQALRNPTPSLEKGELGFISTGWGAVDPFQHETHLICLVFYRGKLAICNRGDNPLSKPTITVFEINSSKITREILKKIEDCKQLDYQEAAKVLYEELPELLSENGVKREVVLFKRYLPKGAKSGTCTMNAYKAAIKAALYYLLGTFPMAHHAYKQWTTLSRMQLIENHLEGIKQGNVFFNQNLVEKAWWNLSEKIEKYEIDPVIYEKLSSRFNQLKDRYESILLPITK